MPKSYDPNLTTGMGGASHRGINSPQADTPECVGAVDEKLSQLHLAHNSIEDRLTCLEERLGRVLRPMPGNNKDIEPDQVLAMSPLASELQTASQRAFGISEWISRLLSELEV